jgi:antitoxin (DNA-binding transcriptional repressor) of toxin-antitoxin stability system
MTMVMQEKISKSQFKPHALELFREIEATGRPLIITDNGVPKLEIRPYRSPSDRLDALRGSVTHFGPDKP